MKIAVYGDSFADNTLFQLENDYSWVTFLRNKNYSVTNYGKSATSLHYSYDKFISTHHNYDKIVFLITGYGRITVEGLPKNDEHITASMVDVLLNKENYTSTQKEIVNACQLYYKYVMNPHKELLFHRLVIEEMQRIRPDGLFIPCFPIANCVKFPGILDLCYFSTFDYKYFNLSGLEQGHYDFRYCHMNEGNNQMFADKVDHWLLTNEFSLTESDAVNPQGQPKDYFKNQELSANEVKIR